MKVLGTTKALTRAMLAVEQSILCAAGLFLSISALLATRKLVFESLLGQPLLFAAYYFSMILVCGIICFALATHKPPLELLQVRE